MHRLLVLAFMVGAACGHGKGGGAPPPDGSGAVCGGFGGDACAADEFCDFAGNDCGAGDGQGTCQARPQVCPGNSDPVCGCDGQVHGNDCEANSAGVDVSANGACAVSAEEFQCGAHICEKTRDVCVLDPRQGAQTCDPLPAQCQSSPTCECLKLQGVACSEFSCSGDVSTGLTVGCPG